MLCFYLLVSKIVSYECHYLLLHVTPVVLLEPFVHLCTSKVNCVTRVMSLLQNIPLLIGVIRVISYAYLVSKSEGTIIKHSKLRWHSLLKLSKNLLQFRILHLSFLDSL